MRRDRESWHAVTRTMDVFDDDQLRELSNSVPRQLDGTILLLVKDGDQPVRQYVHGDTDRLERAGRRAGFNVTPLDAEHEPELPARVGCAYHPVIPWRARLNRVANMEKLRTSSVETRKTIESLMPPDSYVSVRLRHYGNWEQRHVRNWVSSEHNSSEDEDELTRNGAMCARITAGAPTAKEASDLAHNAGAALFPSMSNIGAHRGMPRFGLLPASVAGGLLWTACCMLSPLPPAALLVPLALLAAGLLAALLVRVLTMASLIPQTVGATVLLALPVAANMFAATPMWTCLPWIPLTCWAAWRWHTASLWDDIAQKPRRYWAMQPSRKSTSSDNATADGHETHKGTVVAYPVQRSTMLLTPMTLLTLYMPVGEAAAVQQRSHPVPETLSRGGIYIGVDQNGRKAYIPAECLSGGIAVFGMAQSGKSVLAQGIMQWADLSRDKSDPRHWGPDTRIIDFAMKSDGVVRSMQAFRERHWPTREGAPGASPANRRRRGRVCYLADENCWCLDMLGLKDGRNARNTAASVAATMQFAFEQGDILNDSLDVITTAMTIAIAMERRPDRNAAATAIRSLESRFPGAGKAQAPRSAIGWCVMALGGASGEIGAARALGQYCRDADAAASHGDEDMRLAVEAADRLYGLDGKQGIGDQRLRDRFRASLNKVNQFLECEHVFTQRRGTRTWGDVLAHPGDYHFVFSPRVVRAPDGSERFMSLPDRMDRILAKWMMYRLDGAVTSTCQGWQARGRHTMFVCDELSLLANADNRILCKMKDIWREYGWIPVFATQYPDQLPEDLRKSVMGYGTLMTFATLDVPTAEMISLRMGQTAGWTADAICNLPQYNVAASVKLQEQLQPAFIFHAHDFQHHPL